MTADPKFCSVIVASLLGRLLFLNVLDNFCNFHIMFVTIVSQPLFKYWPFDAPHTSYVGVFARYGSRHCHVACSLLCWLNTHRLLSSSSAFVVLTNSCQEYEADTESWHSQTGRCQSLAPTEQRLVSCADVMFLAQLVWNVYKANDQYLIKHDICSD